ncbi:FtsX-like permease family protein [Ekhidna sp.]|uniref:ABC transporter permease n=1 Tax=Ekhidna sp. TaxID=2608089 RepID=UPI00329A04E1
MFSNFFKITLRNFSRNKIYVFINIIGLGFSLACCIVAYLNWKFESNYDTNHENHARIYKVHSYKSVQGEKVPYGITPIALGEQIRDQIPGITHYSRYEASTYVIKKENNVLEQYIGFGEDDYFEMFTFPFKYGSKDVLLDKSKIILTEAMSKVYFGEGDPRGEILTLIDSNGKEFPLIVGGVLEDIPLNSSMTFKAITHYDNYLRITGFENDDWRYFNAATFVMTDGQYPQSLIDFANNNSIDIQNKARENFQVAGYYVEPLTTLARKSEKIRSNWLNEAPPISAIIGPAIMAIQLLLIACFNFTNTSIAVSSRRLKEIGIRKVMGSQRKQLIFQFMMENLVLCFGALLIGLAIADILVPAYSALWRFIDLKLSFTSDPEIYLFLGGLLVTTALVAGAYPSLYISKYQPVKILRGNLRLGGSSKFSKVLLGAQYMLTALALISALSFYNNSNYQSEFDLGFSKDKMLSISIENQSEIKSFRPILEQMPEINSIASTYNRIGDWSYSRTLKNQETEIEAEMMDFTPEYFDFMALEMVEGRFFDTKLQDHDRSNSIVVNEQLVKEFGWDDPVGQVLAIDDSTKLNVIGVINNFYDEGFFDGIEPTGIRLASEDLRYYLLIKSDMDPVKLYDQLEAEWLKVAPNRPFDAEYDDAVANAEEVNANIMIVFQFLGLVALILSTIGLYTLVSLNIIKRIKEIGVRKVLGASIQQIIVLLNAEFFWLILVSASVGAVISYFVLDILMGSIFEIYQPSTVITMVIPFVLLIVIALSIASARILGTAVKNPVDSLRYE